jgi:hypothetical protein
MPRDPTHRVENRLIGYASTTQTRELSAYHLVTLLLPLGEELGQVGPLLSFDPFERGYTKQNEAEPDEVQELADGP